MRKIFKPSLSGFKTFSDISRDISQVFFASVVIGPLMTQADLKKWLTISFGMMAAVLFWSLSVFFAQKGEK